MLCHVMHLNDDNILNPCVSFLSSVQFTKAVEQKQVAEQDAERAKFVVMLAEQVGEWKRVSANET